MESRSDVPEPSDASPIIVTSDVIVAAGNSNNADGADIVGVKKCNTCGGMFDEELIDLILGKEIHRDIPQLLTSTLSDLNDCIELLSII